MEEKWDQSTENRLKISPDPPRPLHLPDPRPLTEVRVDLVVRAGSGLGLRLHANLSAFRTSLLSTTYERKMRGPWQAGGGTVSVLIPGTRHHTLPPASLGLPQRWAGPGTWMQLQAAKR